MKVNKSLKATIVAMAALSELTVAQEVELARKAFEDMSEEYDTIIVELNPFGGLIA